jgi:predicted TIM-barrel fold metal-dependent hydrolase
MEYTLIDADGHYYEPDDCFSRHIESKYKDQTIVVQRGEDGLGRITLQGQRVFMSVMPGDYASAPGALQGLFVGSHNEGFKHREVISAKDFPEFTDRAARLKCLDEQDVQATLMLPTMAVAVEQELRKDVDLNYASLRAFNRWLQEDWGYGEDGRLFGVPMLSLLDIDQAVLELERVMAEGAKMVHLTPGPIGGHSPADPIFDPFWARCAEANIPVVFHTSNSGYQHYLGVHWSEDPRNPSHLQSPLQWALCNTERPVVDTMIALTLHNLFGRHPDIKIVSIENGSSWLPSVFKTVDKAAALGRRGPMIGGALPDKPSEALAEHLWVCPFPEDDVNDLIGAIGVDHVLFGSDYPHPEGLREPRDYIETLSGQDEVVRRKVLRGNSAALLGLADQEPALAG